MAFGKHRGGGNHPPSTHSTTTGMLPLIYPFVKLAVYNIEGHEQINRAMANVSGLYLSDLSLLKADSLHYGVGSVLARNLTMAA